MHARSRRHTMRPDILVQLRLAAALLALLAAGCGTQQLAAPPPPQAPDTALLPALDSLPTPPASDARQGSAATFPIDLALGGRINASWDGTAIQLTSTASANSAAYFGIAPTYNGLKVPYLAPLSISYTLSGSGEAWLVTSNYRTGRWELRAGPLAPGSGTVPVTLSTDGGNLAGNFWCAFIATGGNAPALSALSLDYPDAPAPGEPLEYPQFITAADGARLATSIYLPYAETNPFIPDPPYPAVLVRTPYDKAQVDAQLINLGTQANVAVLIQYFRGRLIDSGDWPDSDGEEGLFDDHAGPVHSDAIDTVDWLEERLFFNGELVTTGPSALGLASYQALPELGPRVRGFFNQISCMDVADWVMLEGGCFGEYNVTSFLTANNYPATMLSFVRGRYAANDQTYFDTFDYNTRAAEVDAPGYHESGWWDIDLAETIRSWSALQAGGGPAALGQQVLVIGPWTHGDHRGDVAGALSLPSTGDIHDPQVLPNGYDGLQYLLFRLGRNPFYTPPPTSVAYYLVGPEGDVTGSNNSWQTAGSWPPNTTTLSYFLDAGQVLATSPPAAPGSEGYSADPAAPVPTAGGGLLPFGPQAAGPQPQDSIFALPAYYRSYNTGVLAADLTITGEVQLKLRIELDGTVTQPVDTDIAVRLIDEYPDGSTLLVSDGILRLSHALGGPAAVDTPYNVTLSLGHRAYNFAAGHKLVLHISGSNYPLYSVNPGNGEPFYSGANGVVQDLLLHFGDAGGECELILPIL